MDYLEKFKRNILLVDGMLVETGGKFGENMLDDYIDSCVETADRYYRNNGEKEELLEVIDFYIMEYENQKLLKYYDYIMRFLNTLKIRIEHFNKEKDYECKGNGETR